MSSEKSGEKSGERGAGELVDGPNGGKLRRGSSKGNTPGAGRPPDEFKRHMRTLVNQQNVERYLRECLRGKHGPKPFAAAIKYATEYGYGKATQAVEVTGAEGGTLEVTIIHQIVDVAETEA